MIDKILIFILILVIAGANDKPEKSQNPRCGSLNTDHLMHLYSEVLLQDSIEAGIIHIYSEAPDYDYAIEPLEGYTCVDDVARAVVFLAGCEESPTRNKMLDKMIRFILYMQSDNGYFYNFIWHDGSINKTYRTSVAVPDWWSWRALWAMEEYAKAGETQAAKIAAASEKLCERIFKDMLIEKYGFQKIEGIILPDWLPGETAADQAAVLILGMESYFIRTGDQRAARLIRKLAEGILRMQAGNDVFFPFGAFLSWQNLWHAYGNSQAYAMLRAGQLLHEEKYIRKAMLEVDHFYSWLIEVNHMNYFSVKEHDKLFEITDRQAFPQIAYGIRPMVFAALEAYRLKSDTAYFEKAKLIGAWFSGNNAADEKMYDMDSGRCFDAINDTNKINRNSGAESTIEALLSLQALEKAGVNLQEMFNNGNNN